MAVLIKNDNIRSLVNKYDENKLSHVFLIETNNKEKVMEDLFELIKIINCPEKNFTLDCKTCNLCHLIETYTLPSLKIIYPDGQAIKKIQMEELKKDFSSIPYLTTYNVYIINDAEKLNASSANTMLKFIEEPEQNILGFLITNNKENVIHTIKSRCEIIKALYKIPESNCIEDKILSLAEKYLYQIEVEKQESIVYNKIVLDEKLEKEEFVQFFQYILKVYLMIWNNEKLPKKLETLREMSYQEIKKRVELVNEMIERSHYNVNINLLLDYFVLSLED